MVKVDEDLSSLCEFGGEKTKSTKIQIYFWDSLKILGKIYELAGRRWKYRSTFLDWKFWENFEFGGLGKILEGFFFIEKATWSHILALESGNKHNIVTHLWYVVTIVKPIVTWSCYN